MIMKRIFICIAALFLSAAALSAQTPEEIVKNMEAQMEKADQAGLAVTLDLKIPIIGTTSARMHILGDKSRTDITIKDQKSTMWMDGNTMWTWTSSPTQNEVVVENKTGSSSSGEDNLKLAEGITDGYDLTLTKETADAWYFNCKKSKNNTDKDDPKTMTLAVEKGTYMMKELSTKVKGISIALRDSKLGVSESDVTFDISKCPGAKLTDKR
jgi:outer membrane lipoprotein-sorting protein